MRNIYSTAICATFLVIIALKITANAETILILKPQPPPAAGTTPTGTHIEKKLFQFGGPETRSRCIKELKTKGVPSCAVHGWEVTCDDTWVITCTEWATDFMQHEFFLVVSGPDAPDALKQTLNKALEHSLAAAITAAVATPGEVAAKATAAIAAFKVALAADLAVEPILASMQDKFNLSIEQHSSW